MIPTPLPMIISLFAWMIIIAQVCSNNIRMYIIFPSVPSQTGKQTLTIAPIILVKPSCCYPLVSFNTGANHNTVHSLNVHYLRCFWYKAYNTKSIDTGWYNNEKRNLSKHLLLSVNFEYLKYLDQCYIKEELCLVDKGNCCCLIFNNFYSSSSSIFNNFYSRSSGSSKSYNLPQDYKISKKAMYDKMWKMLKVVGATCKHWPK